MRVRPLALPCVAASLALACSPDPGAVTSFTSGPPLTTLPVGGSSESSAGGNTGGTSTGVGASGTESGGGDASSSAASTAAETGVPPDFDPPQPVGCEGKIDFLFVIGSWYTMAEHQQKLQEAFPEFIDIIENDFADFDHHIMTVASRGGALLDYCWECYQCAQIECDGQGCEDWGGPPDYPCNGPFEDCDDVAGAGITLFTGDGASNKRCELYGNGQRYIIKGEPNLEEAFVCTSTLGAGTGTNSPIWSMLDALKPEMLDKGGCNAGFLRDDALLVVVILDDVYDSVSPGTPKDWWTFLLEKKNYNDEAIVVLAVGSDDELPDGKCPYEQWSDNPLRVFTDKVTHGRFESICASSYVPFLEEGAELILDQCSVLIPH